MQATTNRHRADSTPRIATAQETGKRAVNPLLANEWPYLDKEQSKGPCQKKHYNRYNFTHALSEKHTCRAFVERT